MYNFTTETQGLDTFLVCEIAPETRLDTAGLGMLLNNKIAGLCPVSNIQIDNKKFIRYNISSQIPLQQFFASEVDKKRFLTILNNILTAIENLDDYMLDPGMLLLDKEEIYVNVGTLHVDLIYYPVLEERNTFDVCTFVKTMIMNTEFDAKEQDNYVTLLISYLNHTDRITIAGLKEYIQTLLKETNANVQSIPAPQQTPAASGIYQTPVPAQPAIPQQQPVGMEQEPYREPIMHNPVMPPNMNLSNHSGFAIPGGEAVQEPAKKKGFLASLGLTSKKEKPNKEKSNKEKPKKEKSKKTSKNKEIVTPSGMVIPNMDNTKNSTLPQPPKPVGAPSIPQPAVQPAMPQPPVQPAMSQSPVQSAMPQSPVQPVMPQPPIQPTTVSQVYAGAANYGETVVLGADTAGETTVLNAGYNTVQKQRNPYLIRKKTNEKVEINKNIFRIGKEKSYVDYCIMDNTAVSRSHADIIRKNDEFYIVDNNSLNHTFLNSKQIPSSQMQKLEDFMVIKLADEIFEFRL